MAPSRPTGPAPRTTARWQAPREACHLRPDLDHLPQRLVADHEVLRAGRRGAVLEGADLAVGAAHADLEHAEPDRGGRREGRRFLLDQLDLTLAGEDGDGLHARLLSGHTTFVRVRCDGAGAGFSPSILRGPGRHLYFVARGAAGASSGDARRRGRSPRQRPAHVLSCPPGAAGGWTTP